jgi:hypothetical protein
LGHYHVSQCLHGWTEDSHKEPQDDHSLGQDQTLIPVNYEATLHPIYELTQSLPMSSPDDLKFMLCTRVNPVK